MVRRRVQPGYRTCVRLPQSSERPLLPQKAIRRVKRLPKAASVMKTIRAERVWSTLELLRPLNILIAAAGVALGGLLAASDVLLDAEARRRLLVAAFSAALIGGAANALNDVFDLDIDRINRPGRPLPSGHVTPGVAKGLWAVGSAAGVALSFALSAAHVAMALFAALALYAYSAWLKRRGLAGNVLVAFILGLALVYGGWAVGPPALALVGAAFAFLTTLAREITKDVEDVQGDAAGAARTLPLVYGPRTAAYGAAFVASLTIALTPLPFLVLGYSGLYLVLVLLADVPLFIALRLLVAPEPVASARQASAALKWSMVLGLFALAAR